MGSRSNGGYKLRPQRRMDVFDGRGILICQITVTERDDAVAEQETITQFETIAQCRERNEREDFRRPQTLVLTGRRHRRFRLQTVARADRRSQGRG